MDVTTSEQPVVFLITLSSHCIVFDTSVPLLNEQVVFKNKWDGLVFKKVRYCLNMQISIDKVSI